jgi:hypothetical protein
MPYVPPNGATVGLDFVDDYAAPLGGGVNLEFDPAAVGDVRAVSAGEQGRFGAPSVRTPRRLLAAGHASETFGRVNIQRDVPRLYPEGIANEIVVGTPEYVRWRQFVTPDAIPDPIWPLGDGRVRLLGGYNPPPAINVILDWSGEPYTPPPATNLIIDFGALGAARILGATLFDQSAFGAAVFTVPLSARPDGIDSASAFGAHSISLFSATVRPAGWTSSVVDSPSFQLLAAGIFPGGIAPLPQTGPASERRIPSPFIADRIRYLLPTGIPIPTAQISTAHNVGADVRFIDLAGRGPEGWITGAARIEFAQRFIEPPFIASNIFGSHNVARIQVVLPSGWASSDVPPGHQLDINLQRIIVPTGEADPARYGEAAVRNQFEILRPLGWLSQDINFPVVFNYDQYLFVQPYMGTNSSPTQWPSFSPFVENKNRVLGPGGWQSSRFSVIGNVIENVADPIFPPGNDFTLWGGETFIAYRNRSVGAEGWDSFTSTRFSVVYNNAAVLQPQGWASAVVGQPVEVLNLNRTVRHVFPYPGEAFGTAFAAFGIRTVTPSVFVSPPSGFPEVRFNPYPIAPQGMAPPQFGAATVYEFFARLFPRSTNVFSVPRIGEPFVENRNKTVVVSPTDQALYGRATVFNYNTELTVGAGVLTIWGAHTVRDRTGRINPSTISVPVFSVTHRIRNVIPDPPSQQLVLPHSVIIGQTDNPGIVPSPVAKLATLYPEGIYEGGYGTPVILRNTINVPPGIFSLDQLGEPVFSATQFVFPRFIPWPNANASDPESSSDQNWVKPRLTPHTIYAPSGDTATEQARGNHPSSPPQQRIDEGLASSTAGSWSKDRGWPWFGRPDISNFYRSIGPVPLHTAPPQSVLAPSSRHGTPTLTLRRQFVFPSPVRSLRMGLPLFLGVPQFLDFNATNDGLPSSTEFGMANIGPPAEAVVPNIRPVGSVLTLWGQNRVELFNRTITVTGIPHRGNPEQGLTNPYGTALVGFPRVYFWGGYVMTLWGDTRIEFKNRTVSPEGWNSLSLEDDDLSSFADRMRFRRRNPTGGLAGIASTATFGALLVSTFQRSVYARGISGYNSGDHAVRAVASITPPGWDSLVVGIIDRWEAGKVKPHGDDLSTMGTPVMRHTLRPSSASDGVVGTPRAARPIYLAGIPEIGFDGPSVSNPYGCTNRVVTPLPVLPQQNVPQPVVTR